MFLKQYLLPATPSSPFCSFFLWEDLEIKVIDQRSIWNKPRPLVFLKPRLHLLRGCSYGGELARLGGLAHLGEMIFISRSYGIFYLSSIKKFVMLLEKDYLIKQFLQ